MARAQRSALAAIRDTYGQVRVADSVSTRLGGLPAQRAVGTLVRKDGGPLVFSVTTGAQGRRTWSVIRSALTRATTADDLDRWYQPVLDGFRLNLEQALAGREGRHQDGSTCAEVRMGGCTRTVEESRPTPLAARAGCCSRCSRWPAWPPLSAWSCSGDLVAAVRPVRRRGRHLPHRPGSAVNKPCPVIVADPTQPAGGATVPGGPRTRPRWRSSREPAKGVETAIRVPPGTVDSGLRKGDVVKVVAIPAQDDRPASYRPHLAAPSGARRSWR